MRLRVGQIFLILLLLVGCSSEKEPECLVPEAQMVDVMTKLQLARKEIDLRHLPSDSAQIYFHSLFKKRILDEANVSVECFEMSYMYYIKHIDKMTNVYKEMVDTLSRMETITDAEKKAAVVK